jgi:plastocyanin
MQMNVRTVLGAVLLLMSFGCGGSTSSPTSPTLPSLPPLTSGPSVSIVVGATVLTTTAYAPNPVNVAVGTSVTWINNDTTTHTSTSDGGTWDSGPLAPGRTFRRTFTSVGTFTYHCSLHPGMVGTVTVQ